MWARFNVQTNLYIPKTLYMCEISSSLISDSSLPFIFLLIFLHSELQGWQHSEELL